MPRPPFGRAARAGVSIDRRRLLLASVAALAGAAGASCRPAAREDGRVVATLWFSYGGRNREVLLDLVARYNRTQGRVLVRPTYQGDYFEALAKLRTALAAGVGPAMSHVVGEVVPYLERAGVLEPLDRYEGAADLDLVPALAQAGSYQGGAERPLVAVPFNRSTPIMYLDGRLLGRELREPPRTWNDLRDAAVALTRRTDGAVRWGFEVPINWWFWVAMVGQAGGQLVGDRGEVLLGGEAGEKAIRFWQDLVHVRRAMRPPPGRDYNAWQATNQDFLAGRAAVVWTSTAFLRYLEESAGFPVVAAPLPRDVRASVPTGGTFFVVVRSAPAAAKDAAWSFLRWMCEPEQTIEWSSRTGYLPVSRAAVDRLRASGWYDARPNDRAALGQLAHADPWPWSPTLFRVQREIVEPRLEEAVLAHRDAHAVMDEARAEAGRPS